MGFSISIITLLQLIISNTAVIRNEIPLKEVNKTLIHLCKYESDKGRLLHHHNKNNTWDVGYCMNHKGVSKHMPNIPSRKQSIKEGLKELKLWRKVHNKYCVHLYNNKKVCHIKKNKRKIGVKNCNRKHVWYSHYNHGYRVLKNNYSFKVKCYIDNNNKKCSKKEWNKTKVDYD